MWAGSLKRHFGMCMEMLLKSQDNEGICKSDNFIENIYGHVFMTFNDRVKMLQLKPGAH